MKPHGALYNTIVHHEAHAQAVIDGIRATSDDRAALSRITIQDSMWADPPSWELIKPIAAGGGS